MRRPGMPSIRFASSAWGVTPCAFAVASSAPRYRSVAMKPGSRLFTVTLACATVRSTPARKLVSPARAPEERSRPGIGIFTEIEVMLTIRPKRRATMPSTARWISSIGVTMFVATPAKIAARSSSRKSLTGGPPALVTRMSGDGSAAKSRSCPSRVVTSAATAVVRPSIAAVISSATRATRSALMPFNHDHRAGPGKRLGAGTPQAAAGAADDRLAAIDSEIEDGSPSGLSGKGEPDPAGASSPMRRSVPGRAQRPASSAAVSASAG